WGDNDVRRLPALAAELAALSPDVIFVSSSALLSAVQRATRTIPIVFAAVADPVGQGFVASLARPGGNVTGFAGGEFAINTMNVELLKKIAPQVARVAVMYDPSQPAAVGALGEIESAAIALGMQVLGVAVRNSDDVERSIDALTRQPNGGLFVYAGVS